MTTASTAEIPTATSDSTAIPGFPDRPWAWNRVPENWDVAEHAVTWSSPGHSDFWRTTEGVPVAHSGSSLLTRVVGDFEIELVAGGNFTDRYDQVGLMIVASETRWLKAGVELDGALWLSAVHTRDESDWSREHWGANEVHLRAVRHQDTIEVFVATDEGWRNYRTIFLPGPVGVGPYSCSPKGDGFQAAAANIVLRNR